MLFFLNVKGVRLPRARRKKMISAAQKISQFLFSFMIMKHGTLIDYVVLTDLTYNCKN